jgi:hypothetical protein
MSDDEDDEIESVNTFSSYIGGGIFVIALVKNLYDGLNFLSALGNSVALGFLGFLVSILIVFPFVAGFSAASEETNPMRKFIVFWSISVGLFGIFDLVLLQGSYVVLPFLSIFGAFPYEETFWGCAGEWVVVEEGSYCYHD